MFVATSVRACSRTNFSNGAHAESRFAKHPLRLLVPSTKPLILGYPDLEPLAQDETAARRALLSLSPHALTGI